LAIGRREGTDAEKGTRGGKIRREGDQTDRQTDAGTMPSAVCMLGIMVSFAIMLRTLPHPRRQRKGILYFL